jgi:non-ribosomal peptide synthetase component F
MTSRQEDLDFFSLFTDGREEPLAPTSGTPSQDSPTGYRFHDNLVEELGGPGARCSRLSRYFELSCDRRPAAIALECEGERISYADLDQRANRLANLLMSRDIRAGSRVGILLNRSVDTYVALLGVTKTEATFVPIDPAAPADRLLYIAEDSALDLVVTTTQFAASTAALPCASLHLDE